MTQANQPLNEITLNYQGVEAAELPDLQKLGIETE